MDSFLRDLDREQSKMTADIENFNRHYGKLRDYVRQYVVQSTVEWAQLLVSHPQALALVVETTPVIESGGYRLSENEPIRLTACSLSSGVGIYDQLLYPTLSQDVRGVDYHGLRMSDLVDQPRLAEVWPKIIELLENRPVVIFNADWARSALRTVVQTHVLDKAFCLHNRSKEYYGQFYELSLETVLGYQGIDRKREQLTDSRERALMLVEVVRNLAAGMAKHVQPEEESGSTADSLFDDDLGDLEAHPF